MPEVANRQVTPISIQDRGQTYTFMVRADPYTAFDDLLAEGLKNEFLSVVGVPFADDRLIKKAKNLAIFQLLVLDGIPPHARGPVFGILSLPPKVISDVLQAYFAKNAGEDPGES